MNKVQILDCTLRDGGYCNDCHFGFDNEKKIIAGLMDANIDIIECGFLTNKAQYNVGYTKFTRIAQVEKIIPRKKENKLLFHTFD